jgi:hypothetical protein
MVIYLRTVLKLYLHVTYLKFQFTFKMFIIFIWFTAPWYVMHYFLAIPTQFSRAVATADVISINPVGPIWHLVVWIWQVTSNYWKLPLGSLSAKSTCWKLCIAHGANKINKPEIWRSCPESVSKEICSLGLRCPVANHCVLQPPSS